MQLVENAKRLGPQASLPAVGERSNANDLAEGIT